MTDIRLTLVIANKMIRRFLFAILLSILNQMNFKWFSNRFQTTVC